MISIALILTSVHELFYMNYTCEKVYLGVAISVFLGVRLPLQLSQEKNSLLTIQN